MAVFCFAQNIVNVLSKQAFTKLSQLCGLSIRFLSELENGRETCSLVRVLWVLDALGIELTAQPPQAEDA